MECLVLECVFVQLEWAVAASQMTLSLDTSTNSTLVTPLLLYFCQDMILPIFMNFWCCLMIFICISLISHMIEYHVYWPFWCLLKCLFKNPHYFYWGIWCVYFLKIFICSSYKPFVIYMYCSVVFHSRAYLINCLNNFLHIYFDR